MRSELNPSKYLIINADDFGYFPCVSKGIADLVRAGVVTATSIMANRPGLESQVALLESLPTPDIGVHLNVTCGIPLTHPMRERFSSGVFPTKSWWAVRSVLGGALIRDAADEFRAQIDKCLGLQLSVRFLNSHEHIHMLPRLYGIVLELAQEFSIPFVRQSSPDWPYSRSPGAIVRNGLLQGLRAMQYPLLSRSQMPQMLGMSVSGQLDLSYLAAVMPSLKPGEPAELMCHPGLCNHGDIVDRALLSYHDWNLEYSTLAGDKFASLCRTENVAIVGFRHFL